MPATHAREPLTLIPGDALVCWNGQRLPDAPPVSQAGGTVRTLLELGTRIAGRPLDAQTQLSLDIAELLGLAIRHPHALALLDVQAQPTETDPNAKRVDRLQCALVVQTGAEADPFVRLIQRVVNEQATTASAKLTRHDSPAGSYQVLSHGALPEWCAIAWGKIDDCFVLTLGPDVWPQIAAVATGSRPGLSADPWYAAARKERSDTRLIELFVAADALRRQLDPFVDRRATQFFEAWEVPDLTQSHWAFGMEGPALFCLAHFHVGDATARRLYADPAQRDPNLLATVPPNTHYAIYEVPLATFLSKFGRGFYAIQGAEPRAQLDRIWKQVEERGVNIECDLLGNLGGRIVGHNMPPHPLRLPLAVTLLLEIREHAERVRAAVDAIGETLQAALNDARERGATPPWDVRRTPEGIWYLQFGVIAGPAWTCTSHYIVMSWSPAALEEYLAWLPAALR